MPYSCKTPFSLKRKDPSPIILHAHDNPTALPGLVEAAVKFSGTRLPVICKLSLGIVMADKKPEARPFSCRNPFKHLKISVRVTKSGDRPPADKPVDGHRLAFLVIE